MRNFRFTLHGVQWRVRFVMPSTLHKHLGHPAFGYCDSDTHVICIDRTAPPDHRRMILLHELVHAFLSLHVGTKDEEQGKIEEELACQLIAAGLCSLHNERKLTQCLNT